MGHTKRFLGVTVSVSAWAFAASLACAQQAPGSQVPVTPTTPEAVPVESSTTTSYEPAPSDTPQPVVSGSAASPVMIGNPGEPMIDETNRLTFPNRPLLITGSTVFVLSYVPAVVFQALEDRNRDLYIPVAGPWMDFAKGDDGQLAKSLLVADGVLQGLGALAMVSSLVIPEKRTSRWYLIGGRQSAFNVAPARLNRGFGVLAQGSF